MPTRTDDHRLGRAGPARRRPGLLLLLCFPPLLACLPARGPAAAAPVPPATAAAAVRPADPPQSATKRLVVIDAGHGGVDPGARGPGGTREKDITLAVARQLAALLRSDKSLEVRMTRDRDTLIALRDRPRMANRWRGEAKKGEEARPALFISIHANASPQRAAVGYETFFLSEAKTEDARRVAEMENAAQRYEAPSDKPVDPLSFIFHDLRQNKYLRDSSDWASMIQRRLSRIHPGPNRGVKQAGFVVLDGAFMPAVLVEIGFITNPAEERLISDRAQQRRIAEQLAHAVGDFFEHAATAARLAESR